MQENKPRLMTIAKGSDPDLMQWYVPRINDASSKKLIYSKAARGQILFIRDVIAPLVFSGIPYKDIPDCTIDHPDGSAYETKRTANVVGTHYSKSCELPVYHFERRDLGLQFIMRGNFHDWKLSVLSHHPVEAYALRVLGYTSPPRDPDYTGDCLAPVYFEGFDTDWCFGYFSENSHKFSISLADDQSLWTAIFLMMYERRALKKMQQTTRAEHQEELAARR